MSLRGSVPALAAVPECGDYWGRRGDTKQRAVDILKLIDRPDVHKQESVMLLTCPYPMDECLPLKGAAKALEDLSDRQCLAGSGR